MPTTDNTTNSVHVVHGKLRDSQWNFPGIQVGFPAVAVRMPTADCPKLVKHALWSLTAAVICWTTNNLKVPLPPALPYVLCLFILFPENYIHMHDS